MWFKTFSYSFLLGLTATQAFAQCNRDIRRVLLDERNNWSPETDISFPDDGEEFVNMTLRWNIYEAPTYSAAISPANEDDLALAVRLSREHNIDFLATGGRHSFADSLEGLRQGLAIDLSRLNSIEVDPVAETLTIGGGVRTRDIYQPVSQAGFEIPVGSCSCTGMVGVTLGGGTNAWNGDRGMVSDSLLSVRLLTSDGDYIEVSEDTDPELWWGLRGAGANFGIVASATYKLWPHINNDENTVVDLLFPPEVNVSYYQALEELSQNQPSGLATTSMVIWNETLSMPLVVGSFLYFGPREEALAVLEPITALGPIITNINVSPWAELSNTILLGTDAQTCIPGGVHNSYAAFARRVSVPYLTRTFAAMSQLYIDSPRSRGSMSVFRTQGRGEAQDIPDDHTAFPWRSMSASADISLTWQSNDTETEAIAIERALRIRADLIAESGYDELAVHVNLARASDSLESKYGASNLPRLATLKSIWDPDNVFGWHHPIPTSYP